MCRYVCVYCGCDFDAFMRLDDGEEPYCTECYFKLREEINLDFESQKEYEKDNH